MKLFPEAKDDIIKEKVRTSPLFKEPLEELEQYRREYLDTDISELSFSKFRRFFEDGNRGEYEKLYFDKRGRLAVLTLSVLLYGRKKDIQALEDAIWAVCNEYTWVLPAHIQDMGDRYDDKVIDLFAAETGFALSEIYYLLGDMLSQHVVNRIRECLEERIFQVFLNRSFFWENNTDNWVAVCNGCVGATFIYAAPERFPLVRQRILYSMNRYLQGFGEDGVCVEGISYWEYGFSFFVYFAQLLKEFSDGKDDLFLKPICSQIAAFQENAFMRKNHTISFADGSGRKKFCPGLTHKLHQIYGTRLLDMKYAGYAEPRNRFSSYLRNFFWVNPEEIIEEKLICKEKYYVSAQWFLVSNLKLSLAAKCGNNGEPHNHNDVGSFILVDDNGQIICDYGAGEYTREYFKPETRYKHLCTSSRGHSVPLIDGKEQEAGENFAGEVLDFGNGRFAIDMANAYSVDELQKAVRRICLEENCLEIADSFVFQKDAKKITERFVSMIKPELVDNIVMLGRYTLKAERRSGKAVLPVISEEIISGAHGVKETLYLIDYELYNDTEFMLRIAGI